MKSILLNYDISNHNESELPPQPEEYNRYGFNKELYTSFSPFDK